MTKILVITQFAAIATILLTSSIVISTPAFAISPNLVTNGSFEDPRCPQVNWITVYRGQMSINGWDIGGDSVDHMCAFWQATDGTRSIDLSGNTAGSVSQVLQTVPGATYDVSFDMAGNYFCGDTIKHMVVTTDRSIHRFSFDTTGKTFANMGYETKTFSFVASSPSRISFSSLDSSACGPVLDNVIVRAHVISDTTPPVISAPADVTVEATGVLTTVSLGIATATDSVDPNPVITNDSSGLFPLGTTTVTYTATDSSGNIATATQTVTVVDTTSPLITLLGQNPVNVECGSAYTDDGATAFDIVDQDLTSSIVTGGLPINTGIVGFNTVTYDVSDLARNAAATATRTVNVADTTAPTVTATLVPFGSDDDDDDEGKFIVQISGSDTCDASPAVTATLNGVPVTNGLPVKLEIDDAAESKFKSFKDKQCTKFQQEADKKTAKGKPVPDELQWNLLICEAGSVLQMEDSSFILTASATDASGNTVSASSSLTFAGDDDDE